MHLYLPFLMAATFFLAVSTVQAQPGRYTGTPEEVATQQTAEMTNLLKLTEEQVVLVKEINLANALKVQEARQAAGDDFSKMRPLMQQLRAEKNEHLQLILTEKQFKKWEAYQAERFQNRH